MTPKTTTVRDLRRGNRSRALWQLHLRGPLSRQEVGSAIGVSMATVSNLVAELIQLGAVVEGGVEDSTGGRPRGLLRINAEYGYVIGVDIGETAFLVELFDFGMEVRASHRSSTELIRLDPEDAIGHVLAGIDAVIAESGVDRERILGVGVGVPGLVEQGADAVVHGQSVGWDAVPFERLMRARTDLPVLLDNGAKTLGQAERWFGAARDCLNVVVVLLGIGVGASIVTDDAPYRGATGSASEWGHTTVVVGGRTCRCGASGCLEAYIGAASIVDRYDELRGAPGDSDPRALERRIAEIFSSETTDLAAGRVVEETIAYLGAGLSTLINLLNPERIVVGGWLGHALGDGRMPRIRESASRAALHFAFGHVDIVPAQLGSDAVALGAATLPIALALNAGAARPSARR
ncbi:MAG TPA: ROK family protein [Lacisediminihabitans sp.]|uniref:ROK family protein n=1 Tax=Lacisediminihabitans sp. TaxID=2787631 RepID=UPI002EDA46C4